MRKTFIIGAAAIAIAVSGCAKRTPPVDNTPPPAEQVGPNGEAVNPADMELQELPAQQADMIAKAGSDTVYFGTDEYQLDAAAKATLAAQARWMLANTNVRASIEGHCDERGTREYNLGLGERRGNAAASAIGQSGQTTVVSYGEERPACTESGEGCWSKNRRVEIVYTAK